MPASAQNGIAVLRSPYTFAETLQRLETLLSAKGLIAFCRIDHSGEAEKAGMKMLPTKLLVFGSPKAGTPLMIASPSLALDLPLKALVWQDVEGSVWLSYNTPEYLQDRHGISETLTGNIAGIRGLCEEVVRQCE